uniref:MarR family winged helix-turn-helix transcriptional regulator n=1 Tax=Candidatus Limnocylindrus sp. TaxID=2802978 RepID=UPI00404A3F81
AEGLRSRLPAAVRVARGEMGESPLDEVSRRRQSLGEIGGRIVSIRRLWRELVLSTAQQLAPSELSLAQVAALYLLADGKARSVGEIARDLGRSHSATSRLVSFLHERRYLRAAPTSDARMRRSQLAPSGEALLTSIDRGRAEQFVDLVRRLPKAERGLVAAAVAALATRAPVTPPRTP